MMIVAIETMTHSSLLETLPTDESCLAEESYELLIGLREFHGFKSLLQPFILAKPKDNKLSVKKNLNNATAGLKISH